MKKVLWLLVLCLLVPAFCCAQEAAPVLPEAEIAELFDGDTIDLDGDGNAETVRYAAKEDPETGATAFRLIVGDTQLDGEGVQLTGRIHALRMPGAEDALLFLSDHGWSDDDTSYVYSYRSGDLSYIGTVYAMPWELTVGADGILSGEVRGCVLHTWFRPADFVLCTGWNEADSALRTNGIVEMPRDLYPMGTKVTLLCDLTLCISRNNPDTAVVLKEGDTAWLVATDDIEWVYIVPDEHEWVGDEWGAGWLRLNPNGDILTADGESLYSWDVFDGLVFAD